MINRFFKFFLAPVLVLAAYSFYVEPYWIDVTRHTLKGRVATSIRIAHLSDIHTRSFGLREKRLLSLLTEEKPDLIVITGDTITDKDSYSEVKDLLAKLSAPLGVVLVRGNWEHWRPHAAELDAYNVSGVKFLNNQALKIRSDFWIIGVDDLFAGQPDILKATKGVPGDAFRLGLFHSPAFFTSSFESFDLALTGHTHGGQVRIPFVGPIFLPPASAPYDIGWYEVKESKMFVSRGLGNSILDLRFNCRPELAIIEVVP